MSRPGSPARGPGGNFRPEYRDSRDPRDPRDMRDGRDPREIRRDIRDRDTDRAPPRLSLAERMGPRRDDSYDSVCLLHFILHLVRLRLTA